MRACWANAGTPRRTMDDDAADCLVQQSLSQLRGSKHQPCGAVEVDADKLARRAAALQCHRAACQQHKSRAQPRRPRRAPAAHVHGRTGAPRQRIAARRWRIARTLASRPVPAACHTRTPAVGLGGLASCVYCLFPAASRLCCALTQSQCLTWLHWRLIALAQLHSELRSPATRYIRTCCQILMSHHAAPPRQMHGGMAPIWTGALQNGVQIRALRVGEISAPAPGHGLALPTQAQCRGWLSKETSFLPSFHLERQPLPTTQSHLLSCDQGAFDIAATCRSVNVLPGVKARLSPTYGPAGAGRFAGGIQGRSAAGSQRAGAAEHRCTP